MLKRDFVCACVLVTLWCGIAGAQATTRLLWDDLPPLPQGLGGHVAGTHNNALIVAGGSYFEVSPWQGGDKTWARDAYVLPAPDAAWVAFPDALPHPHAYASVVSLPQGLLIIGGSDGARHTNAVILLTWDGSALTLEPWPGLPAPHAMGAAALLDNVVYVTAGIPAPDATAAGNMLWSLDLRSREAGWQSRAPSPGPGRILPVVAAQSNALYLFSGAALTGDAAGDPLREYLTDGYRYHPKDGWAPVQGPPRPLVAAPAAAMGTAHILVFGGDDGSLVTRNAELGDDHPGFTRDILGYHTITNTWAAFGDIPEPLVTTHAVLWDNRIVIPSGEDRPGHRATAVLAVKPNPAHRSIGALDYSVMAFYFAVLVGIGLYFSRRERTSEDFFLGGRRVPWWAAGISIFGTVLSAITFLAVPAMAFSTDWVYLIGNFMVFVIAPIVVFFYLPFFRRFRITSAYEYLELRFNLAARLFGSLSFTVFQLSRMGIVIFLPAIALTAATGIDVRTSIVAMGVLATIYTVLGGIEAVIWTDVMQVIVLIGGAILALALIVFHIDGGATEIVRVAWHDGKFRMANWTWDYTVGAFWVVLVGRTLENLVPYTTDQTVVQRYLTTASEKKAAQSVWLGVLMALPSSLLFFTLGTALYVFYKAHPAELDPALLKADAIFPLFIVEQIPAGITGLIIAAIFAAAMSSLDSSLNSVSSVIVTDFYRRFKPDTTDHSGLVLGRLLTVLLGIIGTGTALLMTTINITSLWEQYMKYVGLFGGSLAGIFALGIFTRRATGLGALIGAAVGGAVLLYVQQRTPVSFLLYSAIGIATSFATGYLASLVVGQNKNLAGLTWFTRHDTAPRENAP
jgi:solute:Na+ symporter, SSS family